MSRIPSYVACHRRAFTALAAAAALGTAASLASPGAAAASPTADVAQTTVAYTDRDLSTDRSRHALYRRIVSAARSVCPGYDSLDLGAFVYSRECQQQAVARAIRQIGDPRLAAVYERALSRHG